MFRQCTAAKTAAFFGGLGKGRFSLLEELKVV